MNPSGDVLQEGLVRRRQVYYIHGFDARGARFYHPLYRDQAAAQDALCGTALNVGEPHPTGEYAVTWGIHAESAEGPVDTRYTFLRWEDVVRSHWLGSKMRAAFLAAVFYLHYFRSGALRRLWHSSRRYTASVLAPLAFGVVSLLLSVLSGWCVAAALGAIPTWPAGWNVGVGLLAGGTLAWGALWWSEKSRLLWLARAWIFVHRWGHHDDEAISERWRVFAQHIANDGDATGADEIVLIGHSAGTWAVVSVLSELLGTPQGRALLPKLRLMTLGQVVPMLSFYPEAHRFRAQVRDVATAGVPWLDFTAPFDPLCTALADPLMGSGAAPTQNRVAVRSARFDRMFAPDKYKRLAKDAFRIHFQYLMATDLPVHNDYFSITAGPYPLAHWMKPRP